MSHVLVCCSFTIQLDKDRVPLAGNFKEKNRVKQPPPKKKVASKAKRVILFP